MDSWRPPKGPFSLLLLATEQQAFSEDLGTIHESSPPNHVKVLWPGFLMYWEGYHGGVVMLQTGSTQPAAAISNFRQC